MRTKKLFTLYSWLHSYFYFIFSFLCFLYPLREIQVVYLQDKATAPARPALPIPTPVCAESSCVQTMVFLPIPGIFSCVQTMVFLPIPGIFNVPVHATQRGGWTNTVRESALKANCKHWFTTSFLAGKRCSVCALKVDCGRKISYRAEESNSRQDCAWFFDPTLYPLSHIPSLSFRQRTTPCPQGTATGQAQQRCVSKLRWNIPSSVWNIDTENCKDSWQFLGLVC